MEKEFKYHIDDNDIINMIIDDPLLDGYIDKDTITEIDMHAVYFDTASRDLRKSGIAYRIRNENERITATIKWDNRVENGLHTREEFNLVINDERFAEAPDIAAFESSDAYDVLFAAAGNKKLERIIEMNFVRRLLKIDTGKSIMAMSFDDGTIHGCHHDSPVMEMEIEWYHGDEEDFRNIARAIADKYSLKEENLSKLQRGFSDISPYQPPANT